MPRPVKPIVISPAMRRLMTDARAAFLQDSTYSTDVARVAAAHIERWHTLPEREELPPAPEPYTCPASHEHGSDRCAFRDRCACQVCEDSRQQRAAKRRQDALQRHEPRPMVSRFVTPTKTAIEGVRQGAYVPGSRSITSVDRTPKTLPEDASHGSHRGYQVHRCRCDSCRQWKSDSARRSRIKSAERAALQQWNSRHAADDDG